MLIFIYGFMIGMLLAVIVSPMLAYDLYKQSLKWRTGGIVPNTKGKSTALKKTTGSVIHGYPKPGDTVYYLADITHNVMKTTLRKITLEMDSQGINVKVFLDKNKRREEWTRTYDRTDFDERVYKLKYRGHLVSCGQPYGLYTGALKDEVLIEWWESSSTNIFANKEDAELIRKELLISEMDKISLDYLKRIKEPVKEIL